VLACFTCHRKLCLIKNNSTSGKAVKKIHKNIMEPLL
jgi:hypothetical protein